MTHPIKYIRVFPDSFSCLVDQTGRIFLKKPNGDWKSPAMERCFNAISKYNLAVAKAVLALACEIQNNPSVTSHVIARCPAF